jgi:hypothetical protein
MYAVKRQFKIWGHELSEAWGRIDFYGRVVLGAAISLGLALLAVRTVIRPLNAEIVSLSKGLAVPENLNPEKDEKIIMHRDKAENLRESLKEWTVRLADLKKGSDRLGPEVHLEVIRALQGVYDRCGLVLVSETLVPPPAPVAPIRQKGRAAPPPAPEGPLRKFTHLYEIRGGFLQIQAMLLLTEELPWRFEIRDITLRPSENIPGQLQMKFTLDIHYLAEL